MSFLEPIFIISSVILGIVLVWAVIQSIKNNSNETPKSVNSNGIKLDEIFNILVENTSGDTLQALMGEIKSLGLLTQPYHSTPFDSNLPDFDDGFWFKFSTEQSHLGYLEILIKDNKILQSGIQIIDYPISDISSSDAPYNRLKKLAERHYGEPISAEIMGNEILNYANSLTISYLSKIPAEKGMAITFRVGNQFFWNSTEQNYENIGISSQRIQKNSSEQEKPNNNMDNKITVKNRAFIIAKTISDYSGGIDDAVKKFLIQNPMYENSRNKIIDELQWIIATGGFIAVRILSNHKMTKDTYKQIINFYHDLQESNKNTTIFDEKFLDELEKKFDNYMVRFNRGIVLRDQTSKSYNEALIDVANESMEYITGEVRHSQIMDFEDIDSLQKRPEPNELELFVKDILNQFIKHFLDRFEETN